MANLPKYARGHDSRLMHHIKKFHVEFLKWSGGTGVTGLQKTAWQIEQYLEEHGNYIDSEFIRTLQQSIEKIIHNKLGSDTWSVKRGRRIQTGRKAEPKKKIPIPNKLSKEINSRILDQLAKGREKSRETFAQRRRNWQS